MKQQTTKYQFFATLISRLEAEGFTFGTEQYLRWEQLLAQLPEEVSLDELKTLVVPVLAANETEQALVYEIYDQCLLELAAMQADDTAGKKQSGWRKWWPMLFVLLSLFSLYKYCSADSEDSKILSEVIEPSYLQLSPNETKTVCIKRNKLGSRPRIVDNKVLNPAAIDGNLGQFQIDSICLTYTAKDTVGADTFRVQLTDVAGGNWQTTFFVTIRRVPLDTIVRKVLQKKARPVSAPLFVTKDLPYLNDIRDLAIPPLNALEKFYQENAKLIKLLLIALFTALLVKILLARDEKRKKLVAETAPKAAVTPLLGLPKAVLSSIKSGEVFYRLLNKFRGRTPDEFYRLSIPKTIAHTIKHVGMVQFKYVLQNRPAEFLLLIDQTADGNHLGQLFELIHEYFQENEVHFERFYWDSQKGIAFNEQHSAGLNSEALQHQYFQSKLLFLTGATQVQTDFKAFQKNWQHQFGTWPESTVLVPVPNYLQQKASQRKRANFSIVPATIEGLQFVLEAANAERASAHIPPSKAEQFTQQFATKETDLLPALQQFFPEATVQWIAATAVYPSLHWPLTLHLGQVIADYRQDSSVLSIEHLFSIANLPWFTKGNFSAEIREQLLTYLQKEQPQLYKKITEAIDGLFADTSAFKNEAAIRPQTAIIGVEKETKDEVSAETRASRGLIPAIQKLTRQQQLLDYIIPSSWRQYLQKIGFPNLGMRDFWKDVVFLMLPLWLLFTGFVWNLPETWDNCEGEIIPYQYEGELLNLCVDSPQDKVLLQEYYARDAIRADNARAVDSLASIVRQSKGKGIFEAVLSRDESDVEPLQEAITAFFGNIGTTYYNKGVNLYESSSKEEQDEEAKATTRDEICYLFERATRFDSLDLTLQKAVRWCLKNQIKSVSLQGQVLHANTQQPIPNAKVTYLGKSVATNAAGQFAFSINQKSIQAQKAGLRIRQNDYLERTDSFALQKIDRETYAIPQPILLLPKPKLEKKYQLSGTIVDKTSGQGVSGTTNIFVNGQLEAAGENGTFTFELTNKTVEDDKITIKFDNVYYEPLTQVLNFNQHTDITLSVTLVALPQELVGVADATKVDAAAGVGAVTDSLDYLLTTILETREAVQAFEFETPIPKMELVEGDTFQMGDVLGDKLKANETVHSVALTGFYLGTYEVTFEEFDRYTRANRLPLLSDKGWGRGKQPAVGVTWYQAIDYCNWLSAEHGYEPVYTITKTETDPANLSEIDTAKWTITAKWDANGYRLPTEAEWEFAARQSGEKIRYGYGLNEANSDLMNYATDNSEGTSNQPLPVGSFSANRLGLYDLSGNVSEWCWDWLGDYSVDGFTLDPKGAAEGSEKVVRGGAYDLPAAAARTTARLGKVAIAGEGTGFRLCRGTQ